MVKYSILPLEGSEREVCVGGICAVIAEYDPFHNGHAYHLAETRRRIRPDCLIVLMSGYVTQRGGFSLFSPLDRAEMALKNGADLVLSTPCSCSARDAEKYAACAVDLLNRMGIVDHLSFGSETEDLDALWNTASALEDRAFQETIGRRIREGLSYPRAVQKTLEENGILPPGLIGMPNVILAVSYLRSLQKTGSGITPVLIRRTGAYHADRITDETPSAGAVRKEFLHSGASSLRTALPPDAFRILCAAGEQKRFCDPVRSDAVLFSMLCRLTPEALRSVPGVAEGIENRILTAAFQARSREQLLQECSTAHFTKARINRILCHLMLGLTASMLEEPPFLRVLGFRKSASGLIREIKKRIPCYQDMKELEAGEHTAAEVRAARLWTVSSGQPLSVLYREKPLIL